MNTFWTHDKLLKIKSLYENYSNKQLAKIFNTSEASIKHCLEKNNLKRERWSEQKISKLKKLVNTKPNSELAIIFNTNYNAIANILCRKKIKRKASPNRKEIKYEVNKNNCWVCTSHCKDELGYPYYFFKGKVWRMSRYMYQKYKGAIPNNIIVRHTCDNPSCINPDHLILGTKKQNGEDKVLRNRQTKGEQVHTNKLTEGQVRKIKKLLQNKYRRYIKEIAATFNVSDGCIHEIRRGRNWKHIK